MTARTNHINVPMPTTIPETIVVYQLPEFIKLRTIAVNVSMMVVVEFS
jgi:hypothetical protein